VTPFVVSLIIPPPNRRDKQFLRWDYGDDPFRRLNHSADAGQGGGKAVPLIADPLVKFWDPRTGKKEISTYVANGAAKVGGCSRCWCGSRAGRKQFRVVADGHQCARRLAMHFHYKGLQRDGKLVGGLIEAASERGAHRDLLHRGVQPIEIALAAAPRSGRRARVRRVGRAQYAAALRQLHTLIAAGVPIAEATSTLGEMPDHPALAKVYQDLTTALRRGDAVPSAFARCLPNLPPYIQRLIEAGDLSGSLIEAIGDAAEELEREAKVRTELRHALMYPAILIGFGILAVFFIFLVVVPRFAAAFKGRLSQLPFLSSVVISTGMWAHEHVVILLSLLVGIGLAVGWSLSQPRAGAFLAEFAAHVPVLRDWSADAEIAHWAAILARLLENRLPLVQSLELARSSLHRRDIQVVLGRVERDVRTGTALSAALHDAVFLTPTALAMIRVGERSGRLAEMMRSLASAYDGMVRDRTKTVLLLVEPAAIIFIGAFVGLVAIAIFQAITSINNVPGL